MNCGARVMRAEKGVWEEMEESGHEANGMGTGSKKGVKQIEYMERG
jgi:hypothetical protein